MAGAQLATLWQQGKSQAKLLAPCCKVQLPGVWTDGVECSAAHICCTQGLHAMEGAVGKPINMILCPHNSHAHAHANLVPAKGHQLPANGHSHTVVLAGCNCRHPVMLTVRGWDEARGQPTSQVEYVCADTGPSESLFLRRQ